MTNSPLVLASQSPRRRELLAQIGVQCIVNRADIVERHEPQESPTEYALRLARTKAQVVANAFQSSVVLGADTIGICDGTILEKPVDLDHCRQMLRLMSGATHEVLSAVAVVKGREILTATSVTQVKFRDLNDDEIIRYWSTGEPQDKSGSYAIQGLGAVFVESITGSYSNVVGLPIEALVPLLQEFEVPVWTI